jgi:uncharacterized protein
VTTLPAPAPQIMPEAAVFWSATAENRLVLQRCNRCGTVVWYPRGVCGSCLSPALEWFEASGRGVVYSYTVNRRGDGPYRDVGPFVLAYVELEEGPRILTNMEYADGDEPEIGMPVVAVFDPTGEGSSLVRFRRA